MGRLVRWKLEEWWRFIGWIEGVGIGDRCLVFGVRSSVLGVRLLVEAVGIRGRQLVTGGKITSWIDENEGSATSN